MSTPRKAAILCALVIQSVALTVALPSFHIWLAGAIGAADAIIAVTCFEADR